MAFGAIHIYVFMTKPRTRSHAVWRCLFPLNKYSWSLSLWAVFLAVFKTNGWPWSVFYSLVRLLFLWHIPCFQSIFYADIVGDTKVYFWQLRASNTVSRELTLGATLSVWIPAKRHFLWDVMRVIFRNKKRNVEFPCSNFCVSRVIISTPLILVSAFDSTRITV